MRKHKYTFKHSKDFWEHQFSMLASWLVTKGYSVSSSPELEDQLDFESKTISINSRQHAENRYYTLIHECGHLLISYSSEQFQEDHPVYAFSGDIKTSRSKAYQVSLVAEEIEAWKRGRRLAKRLGLHVDDAKFDKIMTNCVMSYITNAAAIIK